MSTDQQRKARLAGPSSKKVKFTKAEDTKLALLVQELSENDWKTISEHMAPRTARQCRERWTNYVNPSLSKEPWSQEEDMLLIEKHKEFGNHWKIIERHFTNRSKNNIKHRWATIKDLVSTTSAMTTTTTAASSSSSSASITANSSEKVTVSSLINSEKVTTSSFVKSKPSISHNCNSVGKLITAQVQLPQLFVPNINVRPINSSSSNNNKHLNVFNGIMINNNNNSNNDISPADFGSVVNCRLPDVDDDDTIRDTTLGISSFDPFQFFDRIIDQHEVYIQSLDKSDFWAVPEENYF